jgi:hypothetical protein
MTTEGFMGHAILAVAVARLDGRSSPDWFYRGYHSSLSLTGSALQPPSAENFAADLVRDRGFPNFVFAACAVFDRDPENICGGGGSRAWCTPGPQPSWRLQNLPRPDLWKPD